jgi:hypothetical protein
MLTTRNTNKNTIPDDTQFVLSAAIDTVPAGATGQLTRLDSYHVALAFDDNSYPDFVFDIMDTDPDIWASIMPTINPSMTDPPCGFLFGIACIRDCARGYLHTE